MDMMDPRSCQQTMSHQNSTHYAGSLKLSSLALPHKISLPHLRRYHQKLTVRLAPWRATRQFPHGQASGMASGCQQLDNELLPLSVKRRYENTGRYSQRSPLPS